MTKNFDYSAKKYIMKIFISIFIALNLFCEISAAEFKNENSPNDTAYYCFITDVFSEGGENYIKIRPIRYLSGFNAVIAAKKDGYAEYNINKETKDTTWYFQTGNYIDDSNRTEIKFRISERVKIYIYSHGYAIKISTNELSNNSYYNKDDLCYKYYYKKSEENAYILFEMAIENGKVTIIQQEWTPECIIY